MLGFGRPEWRVCPSLDEACGFAGSLNAPGFSDLN
jgi:hypothetical protein